MSSTACYRRPIIDHNHDFEPDGLPVVVCKVCGRDFLLRYPGEAYCARCVTGSFNIGMRSSSRAGAPSLDDVRAGRWTPGPELAELLNGSVRRDAKMSQTTAEAHSWSERPKPREEIAVCLGCNKVRLKPVGEWCGGTGCKKQGTLF